MKITWEYLGGFTDGEGCIQMKTRKSTGYVDWAVHWVQAGDRGEKVLKQIQKFLKKNGIESSLLHVDMKKYNPRAQDQCRLCINRISEIHKLLSFLEPYLIVKKEECKTARQGIEKLSIQARQGRLPKAASYALAQC